MMNIRRLVILLLVFGFMVQGVNAESGSVGCFSYRPAGIGGLSADTSPTPSLTSGIFYYSYSGIVYGLRDGVDPFSYASVLPQYHSGTWIIFNSDIDLDDEENPSTVSVSASGTITADSFAVNCAAKNTANPEYGASASGLISYSSVPLYNASGISCIDGHFDIYADDIFLYRDLYNNNYSFSIADGINYQIHYTNGNISEWHNFTASGDETWNPSYGCNNADFNFTNLSYTSPVKQYLTSTVTVDINDTDGTISSAIARIDGSNYSMQFIGGLKWRYLFTGTNIIKNYYITNIYATDNEGGQDSESYNASYIHVESRTGGGGGGGGSGDYPSDPTIPPSEPCTLNCDDDDDGTCDRNCDIDDDGICDVNCDDAADRPDDENVPDDFTDFFENLLDGDIPDDFWTDDNLRIHPASLNSTAFYTGWDQPQNITYRFLTNKFIDSCEVTNGTCTIDQSFLVNFNTIINENTTGYSGILTVARTGETAQADIKINVINLCACKELTPWQLNISDEWAQKLVYFVRVKDGAIVCIRWWFMIALLILLLGIVMYDSNRK